LRIICFSIAIFEKASSTKEACCPKEFNVGLTIRLKGTKTYQTDVLIMRDNQQHSRLKKVLCINGHTP
jgi:hypothetical protein